jgi:hypothetical protein
MGGSVAPLDHLAGADLGAVNVLASPILDDGRAVIIDRLTECTCRRSISGPN